MTRVGGTQVNSSTWANTRLTDFRVEACSLLSLYSLITSASEMKCWSTQSKMFSCNPLASVAGINFMSLQFIVKCKEILRA